MLGRLAAQAAYRTDHRTQALANQGAASEALLVALAARQTRELTEVAAAAEVAATTAQAGQEGQAAHQVLRA